jgi:hypothetical protein
VARPSGRATRAQPGTACTPRARAQHCSASPRATGRASEEQVDFQFKDVLEAVGPTAGLVFASWIFLSVLQQRYVSAYERYRALVSEYREKDPEGQRRRSLETQIRNYKRRCECMKRATNVGVVAAILLILTLVAGALNVMLPELGFIKYAGAACALLGLLLVIVGAVMVILENGLLQRSIDSELSDLSGPLQQYRGSAPSTKPLRPVES